jgi:hypothetical protein
MAVAVANPSLLTDGDAAFLRVDNSRPAHALEPGVCAGARNKRFDQGKARPRHGVACDPWGQPSGITGVWLRWENTEGVAHLSRHANWPAGTAVQVRTIEGFSRLPDELSENHEYFVAPFNNDPTLWGFYTTAEDAIAGTNLLSLGGTGEENQIYDIKASGPATCGYARFSDPTTNTDQGILLTDDWRDGAGEDGGRGRAWRIKPGNLPQEIDLNGHDIWGTARLVQCHNAMLLLRHGDERHYFSSSAVNANNTIALNATPSWSAGDRVVLHAATDDAAFLAIAYGIADTDATADTLTYSGTGALTTGVAVNVTGVTGLSGVKYVREVSSGVISLYNTRAQAIAGGGTGLFDVTVDDEAGGFITKIPPNISTRYYVGTAGATPTLFTDAALTNQLGWDAASGKFYLLLDREPKPFYGDGAPVLMMQPGVSTNAFENGFVAAPTQVAITDTTASVVTAPNHRLVAGDAVTQTGLTIGTAGPYYAYPLSAHTLTLHTNAVAALTGASAVSDITPSGTGTIKKTSAAGVPLPPCREGCYYKGRFIGINGRDNLIISDPHDFLHTTLFTGTVAANLGEAGQANWLRPLGDDALLIGKQLKVLGITGLSGASTGWRMDEVTDEYGGIASLASLNVGTDVWLLSRKGVASVVRTVAGEKLGTARTASHSVQQDLADVDWYQAHQACSATWNNRYFLAVPTKGQTTPVNNKVLVHNFLNQFLRLEQQVVEGQIVGGVMETDSPRDSWEGYWNGEFLRPHSFALLEVNGEERLSFATPEGLVCWLHDGWDDHGSEIEDELLTRGYFSSREVLVLRGAFQWETHRPVLSAWIRSAGYNEEEELAGFDALEYDRTQYTVAGQEDYDPDASTEETYDLPHREDYSASPEELLVAKLDVHQTHTEPFRCRVRDNAIQLRIVNTQGSARICGTSIQAKPVGIAGTRKT